LNDNQNFRNGFDWTTDFKRTFPNSEREFSVAFQISDTNSEQENTIDQNGTTVDYQEDFLNLNDGLNREYTAQVDYVHPVGENVKVETGVKSVIRRIDSDYSTLTRLGDAPFQPIASQTDEFAYTQDVYAGYLSFTLKMGKRNSLVAGARYERTTIGGEYEENPVVPFTQEYDNILPSIIFSHQFPNFSNLKASYSQRIQRPSLFFINPFTQVGDPNNLTVGNPELDPEIVDQFELSYGAFVKGTSFNLALFYRRTTDIIEGFVTVNPMTNVSETNYLNIGENNSVGFNLFTSRKIGKIGTVRIGFNLFTYDAESTVEGIDLSRTAVVWGGNAGGNVNLPRDWKFDFFGFARSRRQTLQGENPSFWLYGMGLRKEFNKRFSLGLRAVEPFNRTKNFPSEIEGDNFFQRSDFRIPFRSIGISLRYNFGQLDFKGNRRGRGTKIKNDDQKDGGGGDF
ncbi:MAG: outer membrane beta-barrel family protein, partial [Bacteroidota bacterium]